MSNASKIATSGMKYAEIPRPAEAEKRNRPTYTSRAGTAASKAADKANYEIVCGSCHTPGMVSDIRTERDWKDTVDQMISLGADGTTEQLEAVMRFLLRTQSKVNVNTAAAGELPLVAPGLEESADIRRRSVTSGNMPDRSCRQSLARLNRHVLQS